MRPLALSAALLASTALSACGGDDPAKEVNAAEIRQVVLDFAAADGPEACDMLSPDGIVNIYGGFTKPLRESRAICERRSKKFKGEKIHLGKMEVVDDANVRIDAENSDHTVSYNVKLVRFGDEWLIEKINQSRISE
jgi:hypothetical protein